MTTPIVLDVPTVEGMLPTPTTRALLAKIATRATATGVPRSAALTALEREADPLVESVKAALIWDAPAPTRTQKAAPVTTTTAAPPQPIAIFKGDQAQVEFRKRLDRELAGGKTLTEATSAVFAADPALYEQVRKASYTTGQAPRSPREGTVASAPGAALLALQLKARELKANDLFRQYEGMTQAQMEEVAARMYPDLYEAHRKEMLP